MKIGIVGLGLMGASFAKTLHAKHAAEVLGCDASPTVQKKALAERVIDGQLTLQNANSLDMLVVALYPRQFLSAVQPYLPHLKNSAIVTDFCGIKRPVVAEMQQLAQSFPQLYFVSGHPMAGREYSGYDHSVVSLFEKASMLLTPCSQDNGQLEFLKSFYLSLGFGKVVVCDAESHDQNIAYTSQLCHIVSNAFIKNASAEKHIGYSAGSYNDLTRVARMNSKMWAELMTDNRDKLVSELSELMDNLSCYKAALESGDEQTLFDLLEEGNRRKLSIDTKKKL